MTSLVLIIDKRFCVFERLIYIYLLLGEYWWNIYVCNLTDSLTHDVQPEWTVPVVHPVLVRLVRVTMCVNQTS